MNRPPRPMPRIAINIYYLLSAISSLIGAIALAGFFSWGYEPMLLLSAAISLYSGARLYALMAECSRRQSLPD